MGLFDRLMGGAAAPNQQAQQNVPDPRQGFQQMVSNPSAFFNGLTVNGRKISVPEGMTDGYEIGKYLLDSKQITQQMYNAAMQMAKKAPRR
jgi:hypothetical protein